MVVFTPNVMLSSSVIGTRLGPPWILLKSPKPKVSTYLDFQFQTFRLNLKFFGDFNKIHGGPERAPITDDDNVTLGVNTTISWEIYRARISFENDQIPTRTESHLHLIVPALLLRY